LKQLRIVLIGPRPDLFGLRFDSSFVAAVTAMSSADANAPVR
jgi:hypothetical protein